MQFVHQGNCSPPQQGKENLVSSEAVNKSIWQRTKFCGLFYFKDKSISVLWCLTEFPETCSKFHWFISCAC